MGENGITTMVIDNALHTSIIIVWQPSFNWSRVCLHTYPINRYGFSSSRDVVFEIFHASHCHYILLKKNHPPRTTCLSSEKISFAPKRRGFLRSISFEFTDDFLGSYRTAPILDGAHSRLQISNHTTSCDVVVFWWPSHQSPLQSPTSFHIYQHTHYV